MKFMFEGSEPSDSEHVGNIKIILRDYLTPRNVVTLMKDVDFHYLLDRVPSLERPFSADVEMKYIDISDFSRGLRSMLSFFQKQQILLCQGAKRGV